MGVNQEELFLNRLFEREQAYVKAIFKNYCDKQA